MAVLSIDDDTRNVHKMMSAGTKATKLVHCFTIVTPRPANKRKQVSPNECKAGQKLTTRKCVGTIYLLIQTICS